MKFRFPIRLQQTALSVLFLGAAITTQADEGKPAPELSSQTFYQYLIAEIANDRGQLGFAAGAMGDLGAKTRDAGILRRATQMAIVARQYPEALRSAQLWLEQEPDSVVARQTVLPLLAVTGNTAELKVQLDKLLAQDPSKAGELLMGLGRLHALLSDKTLAMQQTLQITEPYLHLPEAHFARAQAAYAAAHKEVALNELDKALKLRPDWEEAVLFKGLLLQDQPAQVLSMLTSFVQDNPQALDARLALARALVAAKNYAEARLQFEKVLAQQPENNDALYAIGLLSMQLQDTQKAEQIFRDLVAKDHPESNTLKIYLGQIAEEKNQYTEAANWYRQADGFAAQHRAVQLLAKQGKYEEARALLQSFPSKTAEEKARHAIAESTLLREQKRHDEALRVLEAALVAQPKNAELMYEAAMAAENAGQFVRMETLLRSLMLQDPKNAHAYNALGYSLAERRERLDEAAQLIDKALELAPNDAAVLDSKGWVLYLRGNSDAALDILQKAYAQRKDAEIAAHLGEVLWTLGRKPEAQKIWDEALRLNPGNKPLTDTIKKFAP